MKSLCLALAALFVAGCAQTATPTASPTAAAVDDCSRLGTEIARAEETKAAATTQASDAWKLIVPFAVAARHAQGKSAAADAERQLTELRSESQRQGCTSRG